MISSGKLDDFGFAALPVHVMYRNTKYQTVNYEIIPTASRIYFHRKITLDFVLEDINILSPFVQTTSPKDLLDHHAYFVFYDQCAS